MTDRLKFIRLIGEMEREKCSINIPIPNYECAKEVILLMIKRTKGEIKIFVENFDSSVYADEEIFEALTRRPYKIFEGEVIGGIPGHFSIFGKEAYIYQKSSEDGFRGTSNFYNRRIVAGMEVGWGILAKQPKPEVGLLGNELPFNKTEIEDLDYLMGKIANKEDFYTLECAKAKYLLGRIKGIRGDKEKC